MILDFKTRQINEVLKKKIVLTEQISRIMKLVEEVKISSKTQMINDVLLTPDEYISYSFHMLNKKQKEKLKLEEFLENLSINELYLAYENINLMPNDGYKTFVIIELLDLIARRNNEQETDNLIKK